MAVVRVAGSIEIERPVQEVFDFVADQRNEPLYNPDMIWSRKVTEGPIAVGTRFDAETISGGKPIGLEIEVTGFEPPLRMESTTRMAAMELDGGLSFEAVPGGTRMSWSWNLHPRGALVWLLRPLVGLIGRRNERRIWSSLKHYLEGPADDREPAA